MLVCVSFTVQSETAGGSVYLIGVPCSQCPAGTACDDGLCA